MYGLHLSSATVPSSVLRRREVRAIASPPVRTSLRRGRKPWPLERRSAWSASRLVSFRGRGHPNASVTASIWWRPRGTPSRPRGATGSGSWPLSTRRPATVTPLAKRASSSSEFDAVALALYNCEVTTKYMPEVLEGVSLTLTVALFERLTRF